MAAPPPSGRASGRSLLEMLVCEKSTQPFLQLMIRRIKWISMRMVCQDRPGTNVSKPPNAGVPGPSGMCHLPPPSATAVKFGASGGFCSFGGVADNCASGQGQAPDWNWNYNQTYPKYNTACDVRCEMPSAFSISLRKKETRRLTKTGSGQTHGKLRGKGAAFYTAVLHFQRRG